MQLLVSEQVGSSGTSLHYYSQFLCNRSAPGRLSRLLVIATHHHTDGLKSSGCLKRSCNNQLPVCSKRCQRAWYFNAGSTRCCVGCGQQAHTTPCLLQLRHKPATGRQQRGFRLKIHSRAFGGVLQQITPVNPQNKHPGAPSRLAVHHSRCVCSVICGAMRQSWFPTMAIPAPGNSGCLQPHNRCACHAKPWTCTV